ncbi:hypothetical protein OM416_26950 [Paenibacillus sp. LS1]|uniref:hypothetical protein n=1 Tax=Paenibacillus sp. LS1 TaxID=2992120 RepID=UPI002232B576|nr:hypothetical protein [Paenibacillus sp. LS1]MCW3795248.1 hypothetical protein [Paenibacillus sp. LS1]
MKSLTRMQTFISLIFLTTVLLLAGCNTTPINSTNEPYSAPANHQKEVEPDPTLPKELPTPIIQTASGISVPAVQSSYCWGSKCADYVGGITMLEGTTPTPVLAGEKVTIEMDIPIPPDNVMMYEYVGDQSREISSQDGTFHLPQEAGIYYYGAFVNWSSKEDQQVSLGDTSFAFSVQIKETD